MRARGTTADDVRLSPAPTVPAPPQAQRPTIPPPRGSHGRLMPLHGITVTSSHGNQEGGTSMGPVAAQRLGRLLLRCRPIVQPCPSSKGTFQIQSRVSKSLTSLQHRTLPPPRPLLPPVGCTSSNSRPLSPDPPPHPSPGPSVRHLLPVARDVCCPQSILSWGPLFHSLIRTSVFTAPVLLLQGCALPWTLGCGGSCFPLLVVRACDSLRFGMPTGVGGLVGHGPLGRW